MAIEIIATGHYVPEKRVTNDELSRVIDTNDEWIRSHTGIGARHVAADDQATSDLAYNAAVEALRQLSPENPLEAAETLDLIVVCTSSPDFVGFPSVACVVQDKLGLISTPAFDLIAACTGFVYALDAAAAMIQTGSRKRALVVGADVLTRITDWSDRGTCVLFGDAAGAVILERTDAPSAGPERRGLVQSILHAEGSGANELMCTRGGTRNPFKKGEIVDKTGYLYMNGRAVYTFAVKAFTDMIRELLDADGISIDQVAKIIPHQANERIIQAAAKRLGIEESKFYLNIAQYANTSNATIPVALDECARSGGLTKGDLIMTVGFGGGLTYGGNLIVW
ncbi:MAG TPA: beta-ketoacyl-ACP synthase III [Treponemataceae bacterium]|nr:beta-ketoacyl-ACP synthase III [Treponemataceae bacterium]